MCCHLECSFQGIGEAWARILATTYTKPLHRAIARWAVSAFAVRPDRFPITGNDVIERESHKFKGLEHVRIGKAGQVSFRTGINR
jgi:hypothetical protein